jgi:hypothetical protein
VDVCVYACVDLVDVHSQTLAVVIPGLKVRNLDLLRWNCPFDNVSATVANT